MINSTRLSMLFVAITIILIFLVTWAYVLLGFPVATWHILILLPIAIAAILFEQRTYLMVAAVSLFAAFWIFVSRPYEDLLLDFSAPFFTALLLSVAAYHIIRRRHQLTIKLEQLSSIPEEAPEPIFRVDYDGRILYRNPAGNRHLLLLDAQGKGSAPSIWGETLVAIEKSGKIKRLEYQSTDKSRSFFATFVPVVSKGYINVFVAETTEQKRVEEELRTQQEFIDIVLQNAPITLNVLDAEGVFTLSEGTGLERLGLEAGEMVGQSIHEIYADRPELLDNLKAVLQGETRIFLTHSPGGSIYETRAIPLRDNEGNVSGVLGVAVDVTDRYHTEQELLAERNLLRTLIDNLPDYVFAKDLEGRFILGNRAFTERLGFEHPAELIGKTDFDLVSLEEARGFEETERKIMDEGTPFHNKLVQVDNHEGTFWYLTTKVPLPGAGGTINGLVGIARDISEFKNIELELRAAKEAAEAATRAKSEFLANMSHEIRTPMNAVIGMTSLLLDTPLNPEQRDFVETVRTSGESLLTIINDILDFSKIESGKLDLESQPFDLHSCIEDALDLFASTAAEKGVELAYITDENTPNTIIGDLTRLRQILVNLVGNAIKFTEQGEIVVSVTSTRDNGSCRLEFSVRDTGIGIRPERLGSLFQSFSQLDTSTTRRYGGTGLGLVISRRLANLMGGDMWVESEIGVGSTFIFRIRVLASPTAKQIGQQQHAELVGKRVLIVDDNATNREILARQTTRWGMQPVVAESGPDALKHIALDPTFDLAILDGHMPEMDGVELAQQIHLNAQVASLPLILYTSVAGISQRHTAESEFAATLSKPIKPSQLFDSLLTLFNVASEDKSIRRDSWAAKQRKSTKNIPDLAKEYPLRILLTEDNAVNQKVALRMLERLGYRADVAGNGLESIEAIERQFYDVVLMDVHMPVMDGIEATVQIRHDFDKARHPYIIAMTADAMQGDREKCLEAGMDNYITKPVRIEDLINALQMAAQGERAVEV